MCVWLQGQVQCNTEHAYSCLWLPRWELIRGYNLSPVRNCHCLQICWCCAGLTEANKCGSIAAQEHKGETELKHKWIYKCNSLLEFNGNWWNIYFLYNMIRQKYGKCEHHCEIALVQELSQTNCSHTSYHNESQSAAMWSPLAHPRQKKRSSKNCNLEMPASPRFCKFDSAFVLQTCKMHCHC